MNTKNNRRRRASQEAFEAAFIDLLQTQEFSRITVSQLCQQTGLNRSTFYANYEDLLDLAGRIRDRLEGEVRELYAGQLVGDGNYLPLFRHIRANQTVYLTYFKLGFAESYIIHPEDIPLPWGSPPQQLEYRVEFHRAGLNAILRKWLRGGCRETPEELLEIIQQEYRVRSEE